MVSAAFKPDTLCSACSQIDWEALRPPNVGQLQSITSNDAPGSSFNFLRRITSKTVGGNTWLISAGGSDRTKETCALCRIAVETYEMANPSEESEPKSAPTIPTGVQCRAEITTDLAKMVIKPPAGESIHPSIEDLWTPRSRPFQFPLPLLRLLWTTETGVTAAQARYVCAYDDSSKYGPVVFDKHIDQSVMIAGRYVKKRIDFDLVRKWFDHCTEHHVIKDRFRGQKEKRVKDFTLYNVNTGNLFYPRDQDFSQGTLPSYYKFAAVSYVWGKGERSKAPKDWPNTIKDACIVVKELGLEYIWIDEVCITKKTPETLRSHLTAMGQIYAAAAVTIICACGSGAKDPLAGVTTDREIRQTSFRVPVADGAAPLHMISSPRLLPRRSWLVTDGSMWSKRGWTLQEAALSHRILTITDHEVYWQCSVTSDYRAESHFTEIENYCAETNTCDGGCTGTEVAKSDDNKPEKPKSQVVRPFFPVFPVFTSVTYLNMKNNPLLVMENVISEFLARELTFGGDALNAMMSILQTASEISKTEFIWCLPQKAFEKGLCWRRSRGPGLVCLKRRISPILPVLKEVEGSKVHFPSWSPLGWCGEVANSFSRQTTTGLQMFIDCYFHTFDEKGDLETVAAFKHESSNSSGSESKEEKARERKPPYKRVTPDVLRKEMPGLCKRLETMAPRTLLFFYAETARLTVCYQEAQTSAKTEPVVFLPIYLKQESGNKKSMVEAGMTDWCNIGIESDPLNESGVGSKEFEFVLLGYRKRKKGYKYIALQVTEEQRGIPKESGAGNEKTKELINNGGTGDTTPTVVSLAAEHDQPSRPEKRKFAGDDLEKSTRLDHAENGNKGENAVVYRLGLAFIKPDVWKRASRGRRLVALG